MIPTMILRPLILPLLPALVLAQRHGHRGDTDWGPRGAYQRIYDPGTVETFRGSVVAVDTFTLGRGGRVGVHLRVARQKDTLPVHLGPAWYLDEQELSFARNDSVTVKGSRITFQDRPAVIAAEALRGGGTLVLRDSRGIPARSGWRRLAPR